MGTHRCLYETMLDCAETTGESSSRETQLSLSLEGFYICCSSLCCGVCNMFNADFPVRLVTNPASHRVSETP